MDTFRSELQPWGVKVSLILPGYYKTGKEGRHPRAKGRYPPSPAPGEADGAMAGAAGGTGCSFRASLATSLGMAATLWLLGSGW